MVTTVRPFLNKGRKPWALAKNGHKIWVNKAEDITLTCECKTLLAEKKRISAVSVICRIQWTIKHEHIYGFCDAESNLPLAANINRPSAIFNKSYGTMSESMLSSPPSFDFMQRKLDCKTLV